MFFFKPPPNLPLKGGGVRDGGLWLLGFEVCVQNLQLAILYFARLSLAFSFDVGGAYDEQGFCFFAQSSIFVPLQGTDCKSVPAGENIYSYFI